MAESLAEPVPHVLIIALFPTQDMAGNFSLEDDGPDDHRFILHDLLPMHHERTPISGWEGCHAYGLRVQLLFEEDGQVVLNYSAKEDVCQ